MESIIRELISLDQKARAIVAPAENELANLEAIIQSQAVKIHEEIDKDISAKITQMRANSAEYIALKKTEVDEGINAKLAGLEEQFVLNSERWQKEIFTAVISS